jgi:hypothetical protein
MSIQRLAAGWTVGVRIPVGARHFSPSKRPDRLRGPHSFILSVCRRSFPGVKRLGREVNHSPASSAEVKKRGAILLIPLYALMAWTGKTLPIFTQATFCCRLAYQKVFLLRYELLYPLLSAFVRLFVYRPTLCNYFRIWGSVGGVVVPSLHGQEV